MASSAASADPATADPAPWTDPVSRATTTAVARLLIHATDAVSQDGTRLASALRRCRAWAGAWRMMHDDPPGQVLLQIADLQGRPFFSANAWRDVIDVTLPAGIYHVTVRRDGQHRRYTVALDQGATINLHLRATPAGR